MGEPSLVFSLPRRISRADLAELEPMQANQLEIASARSFGGMTLEKAMRHLDSNDSYWEYFRITRP